MINIGEKNDKILGSRIRLPNINYCHIQTKKMVRQTSPTIPIHQRLKEYYSALSAFTRVTPVAIVPRLPSFTSNSTSSLSLNPV